MNFQHQFSQVPSAKIERSVFDRSHQYKTTFDAGFLVPFYLDEVLPGDTFNLKATLFARMATPITPIMDNLYLDTQFFFVPCRLLWDHWQNFMGEQVTPVSPPVNDYLVPVLDELITQNGSLADYFGLPLATDTSMKWVNSVNALPFRAYHLIWNEWYRSEDLQDSIWESIYPDGFGDGPDRAQEVAFSLHRRGKRHDYFTSALPWPQKGVAVTLPLAGDAPVHEISGVIPTLGPRLAAHFGAHETYPAVQTMYGFPATAPWSPVINDTTGRVPDTASPYVPWQDIVGTADRNNLFADLSHVSAATINDLRQAFQIQKLFERDARGGTRYTEILRSHFGVVSPDSRLQRPEYLGGSSTRISINPVEQTGSTNSTSPQGNLAAFGVCGSHFHGFNKSFVEHGYVMGLVSVRADLTYQQGLHRLWSRRGRFDFYWPALAHLGEQPIFNKEIRSFGTDYPSDDEIFGYQERWSEYRYFPGQITGAFRSSSPTPLDVWHLAQYFFPLGPTLNSDFIEENPPVDRVIAVPSEPQFLLDSYIRLKCARPMPVYSVPGLIDHF